MNNIQVKNILILLGTFLFGFISSFLITQYKYIDFQYIFSLIKGDKEKIVLGETECIKEECVCEECPVEEENTCPIVVDVSGAVKKAGVYCMENDSTVIDAVKKAGGFSSDVGYKYVSMKINLATKLINNSKIYIPYIQDFDCDLISFDIPKDIEDIVIPEEEENEEEDECININTASKDELTELSGIGDSTASKIIDGRPYESLEDLLNVKGIGEATLEGFRDQACV